MHSHTEGRHMPEDLQHSATPRQQQQWQHQQRRKALLQKVDVHGTSLLLLMCLISIVLFSYMCSGHPLVTRAVAMIATKTLLMCCQLFVITASHPSYKQYRAPFILFLQTLKFVVMLKYLPVVSIVFKESPFYQGREITYACLVLLSGLGSVNIAFDILTGRFALWLAIPFALLRLAVSIQTLLPTVCAALSDPVITSAVATWVETLNSVSDYVTLIVGLPESTPGAVSNPCPGTALALWCHCCLAGFVPLYLVGLMNEHVWLWHNGFRFLWFSSSPDLIRSESDPEDLQRSLSDHSDLHHDGHDRNADQDQQQIWESSRSCALQSGRLVSVASSHSTAAEYAAVNSSSSRDSRSALSRAPHALTGQATSADIRDSTRGKLKRFLCAHQQAPQAVKQQQQQAAGLASKTPDAEDTLNQQQQFSALSDSTACSTYGWYALFSHIGIVVVFGMLLWIMIVVLVIWQPAEAYLKQRGLCV